MEFGSSVTVSDKWTHQGTKCTSLVSQSRKFDLRLSYIGGLASPVLAILLICSGSLCIVRLGWPNPRGYSAIRITLLFAKARESPLAEVVYKSGKSAPTPGTLATAVMRNSYHTHSDYSNFSDTDI